MLLNFERYLKVASACGPAARFLLEVILGLPELRHKPRQSISVKSFAKTLGLDETVVSGGLSELVSVGVLERLIATRSGEVGRGKVTYELCPSNEAWLADHTYPQHAELLKALFSGADMAFSVLGQELRKAEPDEPGEDEAVAKPKKGKHMLSGGRGRLSIRNRLLFAVLLSRSDQFGEVQIGVPRLAELVGMKHEQVKTRLDRLMMLGLIRRHIPGLSSKVFASGRIESTYFLNIDAFRPQGAIAVHITCDGEGKGFTHADLLRRNCMNSKGGVLGVEAPNCLVRLLAGQQWRVFLVFQNLLYRYASRLLSCHWQTLAADLPVDDSELIAWIANDFIKFPKSGPAIENDPEYEAGPDDVEASFLKDGAGGAADQTCAQIYKLALEVAHEYRSRFGQVNWVDFASADIRILPTMDELGYRAITILCQPVLVGLDRFSVFHEKKPGVVELWPVANETDLVLQNRMDFGLVSLPLKVRKAMSKQ